MPLRVNHLMGFGSRRASGGGGGGSGSPNPPEYRATVTSTTNAASYTFTAADIGAADADRVVVVAFGWITIADVAVTSVTIGGVAATVIQNRQSNAGAGLAYAAVPTGTTGDIVITYAGAGPRNCHASIYRIVPSSATPVDFGDTNGSTATVTVANIEVVTNGALIWCSQGNSSDAVSAAYDGVDTPAEDYDAILETTSHFVSFSLASSEANAARNPGSTTAGLATKILCAVSFGPAA